MTIFSWGGGMIDRATFQNDWQIDAIYFTP